jgi:hypothetical protein
MTEPPEPDEPVLPAPLEQAVELFVYAPLGFALGVRQNFPEYVARGRREIGHLHRTLVLRADAAVRESAAALRGLGLGGPASMGGDEQHDAPADEPHDPPTLSVVPDRPEAAADDPEPAPATDIPAEHLAIPGYESLSASQVVPRLVSLTAEELELVRRYEAAVRGRKTILSRIAQLQAG